VTLPDNVGDRVFYAIVNETRSVAELLYTNNTSEELTVTAISPFTAAVQTDKAVYRQGDLVIISGQISGDRTANAQIDVYMVNAGARDVKPVTTDANGRFTLEWQLFPLQSGHFTVGACFKGDPTTEKLAAFDVYGLKRTDSGYITCDVTIGEPKTGVIRLENAGTLALSGVKAEVFDAPDGCLLQQLQLFFGRGEQLGLPIGADDLARMIGKGDDERAQSALTGHPAQLADEVLMTAMHAIEKADGGCRRQRRGME
jgi:hypothetical protein